MNASLATLATAFAAGGISFLSPCVLPLVPGYVSYVAGQAVATGAERSLPRARAGRVHAVGLSLCFVLGFSTVFVLLGASATALGRLLLAHRYELGIAAGAIVIAFGLFYLGLLRLPWLMREVRFHVAVPGGRPLSAYLLGLAFAFGWTPCIGPILGSILAVSTAAATVGIGMVLLAAYSLGLGVPFVLAALFTDGLAARLKAIGRAGRALQLVAGAGMVLMGVAMITGDLNRLSYWILDAFPGLAAIG